MGWFWASETSNSTATCPVNHEAMVCPVKTDAVQCPVTNSQEFLDPSNNMPFNISSDRAPGQKVILPTERTISTIPRGDSEDQGFWSYPSPQQMLNAMLKKGKGSIPEDAVESMVDVHNFLNEGAWQEIMEWEKPYTQESHVGPRLSKFTGRPFDRTPRAQWFLFLSDWFPQTFNNNPPFDRHDWTVLRSEGINKGWKSVRYVIDYYGGPDDEETGMPTFFLDVRPGLDNLTNAKDRFVKWSVPVWDRAMGKIEQDKD